MSRTTNQSIQPLKEDERLTIDPKSPVFWNQAQQVSNKKLTRTYNQGIQPLRNDERLTTDCKSPIFLNQKLQISKQESTSQVVDEAKLATTLRLNLSLTEGRDPYQKQHRREDFKDHGPMSPTPKRRYQRRNSKTAAMLGPSVTLIQQRRYQRRNSAVASMLFPLTKEHVSPFNLDLPMDEERYEAILSAPSKKRRNSDTCESTGTPEDFKTQAYAYEDSDSPKRLRAAQSPIMDTERTT
jgi:hypothetical protein